MDLFLCEDMCTSVKTIASQKTTMTNFVFVASRVFAKDGAIGKSSETNMENEALLWLNGPVMAQGVWLDDNVHDRHLLLVGKKTEDDQRRLAGDLAVVQVSGDILDVDNDIPTRLEVAAK